MYIAASNAASTTGAAWRKGRISILATCIVTPRHQFLHAPDRWKHSVSGTPYRLRRLRCNFPCATRVSLRRSLASVMLNASPRRSRSQLTVTLICHYNGTFTSCAIVRMYWAPSAYSSSRAKCSSISGMSASTRCNSCSSTR